MLFIHAMNVKHFGEAEKIVFDFNGLKTT